jgi:hypothetical protein
MAQFEKGNKMGKGRPKGSLNRSTEQAKLTLSRLANKGLDNISEDIEQIRKTNPVKAAELYIKILEYVVPKLKAVDMKVEGDIKQRIEKITIEIKQAKDGENNKQTSTKE